MHVAINNRPDQRLFSLKWRALLIFSLLLLGINAFSTFYFSRNLLGQFELEREASYARQVKELDGMVRQSSSYLQALADIAPSMSGMEQSLLAGNPGRIAQAFERHWQSLQIGASVDAAQLYTARSELIQSWQAGDVEFPPPEVMRGHVQEVNRTERPLTFVDCTGKCTQYAVVPMLARGRNSGVIALGATLASGIVSFKDTSGVDIGILSVSTGEHPQNGDDARTIRNWHARVLALTNLEQNLPLLQSLATKQSSLAALGAGSTENFGGRELEVHLLPIEKFAVRGNAYFVLIDDITNAKSQIRNGITRNIAMGLAGLILSEIILLLILWRPLSRLRKTADVLPSLVRNEYAQIRGAVSGPRRNRWFKDEFDILDDTLIGVSRQLEDLHAEVAQRTAAVEASNRLLEHELAERKLADERLRESEARYRGIFEFADDIIYVLNPDGTLRSLSPAFERITGWKVEEWIGKPFGPLLHPEDLQYATDILRNTLAGRSTPSVRLRVVKKSGEYFDAELSITPLGTDVVKGMMGIARDVTARKQFEEKIRKLNEELETKVQERTRQLVEAQDELVRREKLAVLGQVAGSVGHELRNPLGVMSNAVYFLQTVLSDADDTTKEYLNIIKNEITGSERIVSDLLDSVRTKPPQPGIADVRTLIEQTLHKLTIPSSVTVKLDIPASLPPLHVDALQIHQVFRNLISNGVEAMTEGGTLEIRAIADEAAKMITVSVRDSGTGITQEQLSKLFQPLFTTKARGIGLGLVVVKNLTQANGGRVDVQSEPGKGTTFSITLPGDYQAEGRNGE